jgi:hypothetical protein
MCCSLWPVRFSGTIVGTWEVLVGGRLNHVLWYQNRVGANDLVEAYFDLVVSRSIDQPTYPWSWQVQFRRTLADYGIPLEHAENEVAWRTDGKPPRRLHEIETANGGKSGNCLIIPIPGVWESIKLLNTVPIPDILSDIAKAVRLPPTRSGGFGAAPSEATAAAEPIIIIKFDIYDIVLAKHAPDCAAALQQIDPAKRAEINPEIFDVFDQWYGCPVALCCFKNSDRGEAKPIAFTFEPLHPDKIIVYTLDGHNGRAPLLDAVVPLDHTVFVGSYLNQTEGAQVTYTDHAPSNLQPYILDRVMGTEISEKLENGDIMFLADEVRKGIFNGIRSLPPHAVADVPRLGHRISRAEPYSVDGTFADTPTSGRWSQLLPDALRIVTTYRDIPPKEEEG